MVFSSGSIKSAHLPNIRLKGGGGGRTRSSSGGGSGKVNCGNDNLNSDLKKGIAVFKKPSGRIELDNNLNSEEEFSVCRENRNTLDCELGEPEELQSAMDRSGGNCDTKLGVIFDSVSSLMEKAEDAMELNKRTLIVKDDESIYTEGNSCLNQDRLNRLHDMETDDEPGQVEGSLQFKGMTFCSNNPMFWEDDMDQQQGGDCNMGNGDNPDLDKIITEKQAGGGVLNLESTNVDTIQKKVKDIGDICLDFSPDMLNSPGTLNLIDKENGNSGKEQNANDKGSIEMPKVVQPNVWKRHSHVMVDWSSKGKASADGRFVDLNMDAVKENQTRLEKALVGKLIGKKLPFHILATELRKRWEVFGEFQFLMMGDETFTCVFQTREARDAVLMGGPWLVRGHIMGLDRWTPSFSQDSLIGLSTPIWIRFPKLPLLYWDNDNLARIASMVGPPLWIDAQTSVQGRCSYARVCVRLDLAKKLPIGVWIHGVDGNFLQPVEFEGLHQVCFKCGHIGHKEESCGDTSLRDLRFSRVNGTNQGSLGKKANSKVGRDREPLGDRPDAGLKVQTGGTVKVVQDDSRGIKTSELGETSCPEVTKDGKVVKDSGNASEEEDDTVYGPWIFVTGKKRFVGNKKSISRVASNQKNAAGKLNSSSQFRKKNFGTGFNTDVKLQRLQAVEKGKNVAEDGLSSRLHMGVGEDTFNFSAIRKEGSVSPGDIRLSSLRARIGKVKGAKVVDPLDLNQVGFLVAGSKKRRIGADDADFENFVEFHPGEIGNEVVAERNDMERNTICGGDASPSVN